MIIGISGKMHSGKDTLAGIIQHLYPEYEIVPFAKKLKQMASILLNVDEELFNNHDFKNSTLGPEWNWKMDNNRLHKQEGDSAMTVREFLQFLGTDALKEGLHPNVWINALFSKDYKNVIIPDVRFPEEAEAIKKRGGILIRIERDKKTMQKVNEFHKSEVSLDGYKNFDYIVENNKEIADLWLKAIDIIKDAKNERD